MFLSVCTIENPTNPTAMLTRLHDIYFVTSVVSGSLERSHDELDSSYKGQGHQRSKSLGEPKKMAKQCKCSNSTVFDSTRNWSYSDWDCLIRLKIAWPDIVLGYIKRVCIYSITFHKKLLKFLQRRWNLLCKTTQTA